MGTGWPPRDKLQGYLLRCSRQVLLDLWVAAESPVRSQEMDVDSPARPEAGPSAGPDVGSSVAHGDEMQDSFVPPEDDSFFPPEDEMEDSFVPPEDETVGPETHGASETTLSAASQAAPPVASQTGTPTANQSGDRWDLGRILRPRDAPDAPFQEKTSTTPVGGLTASYEHCIGSVYQPLRTGKRRN